MRFLLIFCTAIWLLFLLGTLIFTPDLAFGWFAIGLLLAWGLLAVGVVFILVLAIFCAFKDLGVSLACLMTVAIGVLFFFGGGHEWGQGVRFRLVRPRYEAEIIRLQNAIARHETIDKSAYEDLAEIEESRPLRAAFYWQRGVTDNWMGLVYDPTGEVTKVNRLKGGWSALLDRSAVKAKGLFGGQLYRAEHLSDAWYLCSFT